MRIGRWGMEREWCEECPNLEIQGYGMQHVTPGASLERRVVFSGMVDLEGFEPSTSSMPWKRAPNCATGPYR